MGDGKERGVKDNTRGFGTVNNRGPPIRRNREVRGCAKEVRMGGAGRGEKTEAQGRRHYLNCQTDVQPISSKFNPKTPNNGHLGKERKVHLRE